MYSMYFCILKTAAAPITIIFIIIFVILRVGAKKIPQTTSVVNPGRNHLSFSRVREGTARTKPVIPQMSRYVRPATITAASR